MAFLDAKARVEVQIFKKHLLCTCVKLEGIPEFSSKLSLKALEFVATLSAGLFVGEEEADVVEDDDEPVAAVAEPSVQTLD